MLKSASFVHLNFDEIRLNAKADGIDIHQITIIYANLTNDHIEVMNSNGVLVTNLGNGNAIGRFKENGDVVFPEMATSVLYLGA
jgi:hypothetical protein